MDASDTQVSENLQHIDVYMTGKRARSVGVRTLGQSLRLPKKTACLYAIRLTGHWREAGIGYDNCHGWRDDAMNGNTALQSALQRQTP